MGEWTAFPQVQAGASASLLGLVFVGLSINFTRIIDSSHLPNRALEALIILLLNLVVASLLLAPGQPLPLLGNEVLGLAVLVWIWVTYLHVPEPAADGGASPAQGHVGASYWARSPSCHGWAGGAMLLPSRRRWARLAGSPASCLATLLALLNAWVLLVEINR